MRFPRLKRFLSLKFNKGETASEYDMAASGGWTQIKRQLSQVKAILANREELIYNPKPN